MSSVIHQHHYSVCSAVLQASDTIVFSICVFYRLELPRLHTTPSTEYHPGATIFTSLSFSIPLPFPHIPKVVGTQNILNQLLSLLRSHGSAFLCWIEISGIPVSKTHTSHRQTGNCDMPFFMYFYSELVCVNII